MPSKQQERNALTEIKEIVNLLGSDSYLAAAFAGVFDYAETNIENDIVFGPVQDLKLEREDHQKTRLLHNGRKELVEHLTSSLTDTQEALIERNKELDLERPIRRELEERCHTYDGEL